MSLPTNQISSIIGAGGGDYTTLTAWEADLDDDTFTQDYVAEVTGTTADSSAIYIAGVNTTSSYKVIIRPADGEEPDGTDSPGAYLSQIINVQESANVCNVDISMEFVGTGSGIVVSALNSLSTVNIIKCVVRDVASGVAVDLTNSATAGNINIGTCLIRNCGYVPLWHRAANATVNLYNTTLYGNNYGVYWSSAYNSVKNTVSMNNTSADFKTTIANATYCCDEDSSLPTATGNIEGATVADQWTDPANDDFTILDTDSDIYHSGTTISDSWFPSTDLVGTTWNSTPSIGCFEFVSSGGTTITGYCSDGTSMSDSIAKYATFSSSCSDGMSLSDSDQKVANFLTQLSSSASFSDVAVGLNLLSTVVSDGVTISDSATSTAALSAQIYDNVKLNALPVPVAYLIASSIDSVVISDNNSVVANLFSLAIDSVKLGDSSTGIIGLIAYVVDSIKSSDQCSAICSYLSQATDGVNLQDSSSVVAAFNSLVSDGVTFTDSSSAEILGGLVAYIQDGLKASDSASVIANLVASASDIVSFSELLSTVYSAVAYSQDTANLSDSSSWAGVLSALASDGIKLTDYGSALVKLICLAADSITVNDNNSTTVKYTLECSDGVQFTDNISTVMRLIAILSDGVEFSDRTIEASTLPNGKVRIVFSTSTASIVFDVNKPSISFDVI